MWIFCDFQFCWGGKFENLFFTLNISRVIYWNTGHEYVCEGWLCAYNTHYDGILRNFFSSLHFWTGCKKKVFPCYSAYNYLKSPTIALWVLVMFSNMQYGGISQMSLINREGVKQSFKHKSAPSYLRKAIFGEWRDYVCA